MANKRIKKKKSRQALLEKYNFLLDERRKLKKEQAEWMAAVQEITTALDVILLETAKKYGEKEVLEENGAQYILEIPKPKIDREFKVVTNLNQERNTLVIKAIKV